MLDRDSAGLEVAPSKACRRRSFKPRLLFFAGCLEWLRKARRYTQNPKKDSIVSQNRGPNIDPKYSNPCYRVLQNGTPDVGKPPLLRRPVAKALAAPRIKSEVKGSSRFWLGFSGLCLRLKEFGRDPTWRVRGT